MDIDLQIIYPYDDSFSIEYSGPVELTQDGFIRWSSNGTFDVQLVINGYQASIINVLNHEQINNVCSLFNTINGNVNEDTYKKYIRRNENV